MAGRRNARASLGEDHIQAIAEKLEAKLFHRFENRQLLSRAFMHPSAVSGDVHSNQRLEFLGDRVLGLVVAEMLHTQYPGESEGELARRFTALVRREALERIARDLRFGDYLILAKGEEDSGGRENSANLADACEAVIAAIFIDGGYGAYLVADQRYAFARFIRRYWAAPMNGERIPPRDAKSALQEWAQAEHGILPVYSLIARQGPAHAPHFEIQVQVGDFPGASASGGSKQAAEQAAAQILMLRLVLDHGCRRGTAPRGFRRHSRGAQCREIHPRQSLGRLQSVDRIAKSADHPFARARHSHGGRGPTRPGGYARNF